MIGLDTNVLLRYLTQDDPAQAAEAGKLIEKHCSGRHPGHISQIVLCELVWVLRGAYGYEKALVVGVLEQLLVTAELQVEREALVRQALQAWREGPADFSDYLILFANRAAGCEQTCSFDRALAKHPLARLPRERTRKSR